MNENEEEGYHTDPNNSQFKEYSSYKETLEDNDGENRNVSESDKASVYSTSITILKSMIGCGILSYPFIFKNLGIYYGTIALIISIYISVCSISLLMRAKDVTQRYSYSIYSKFVFGKKGYLMIKFSIILTMFLICIIYLKIFGNVLKTLVLLFFKDNGKFYFKENFFLILIAITLMPLMFKKDISALRKYAFIGVICIFIFIFSFLIIFFIKFKNNEIKSLITPDMFYPKGTYAQFFASFSAIINSLSFHQNCFPIYLQIKQRNSKNMIRATAYAAIATGIIYWIIGLFGYSMYGNVINDILITYFYNDIQKNLNKNKIISIILIVSEIAFFLQASFTLPLLFFALKSSLFNLLLNNKKEEENNSIELKETNNLSNTLVKNDNEKNNNDNSFKKNLIIIITYCLILIFGIFFEKVLMIENVVGSTANNILIFLAPATFVIKLDKTNGINCSKINARIMLLLGLILLTAFFYFQIYH